MNTARRYRVALLDHTAALSGAELAMERLLRAVDREVFDPVVVLFADGPLVPLLRSQDIPTHIVPLDPDLATRDRHSSLLRASLLSDAWRVAAFVRRLRSTLLELDIDVVHASSLKADLLGGAASRLAGRPLVWHVHDRLSEDYVPALVARALRWSVRHVPHYVLANSEATLETLRPLGNQRHAVAYPGLAMTALPPARPRLATAAPEVGIVGRVSPTKGQDVFLRAAAHVAKSHPHIHFRVVGAALFNERDFEVSVRKLAADLGLADRVTFTGFVHDVLNEISNLDVLVHASPVPEPFGQVVLEALACGVPVVATDAGGVPEILGRGTERLGVLVQPGSVGELAAAIRNIVDDPSPHLHRAAAARSIVQSRFSIETTASVVQHVWLEVLSSKQRSGRRREAEDAHGPTTHA